MPNIIVGNSIVLSYQLKNTTKKLNFDLPKQFNNFSIKILKSIKNANQIIFFINTSLWTFH